ncbi:AraC family transcriptional regulator [Paenibacillus koleovorans]|uniref:AraC family transcriptional regulator n=1 Tax=Paenibacillus koleovorans TaxID=121608 RepID=UPI000FDC9F5A|nr:AraC family transcriptional regulator [Paenibacillus koleovorans]
MDDTVFVEYGSEEGDFYFHHIRRTNPFGRQNHYHSTYEIYFLLSGQRTYFIKDRSYLISPGNLVFINKQDVHKTMDVAEPGHERVVINFSDKMLGEDHAAFHSTLLAPFAYVTPVFNLKLPQQSFVKTLLEKMSGELQQQQSGYEAYIRLLLTELLLFAGRLAENQLPEVKEQSSPLHRFVTAVIRHINEHFQDPLSLNGLAVQFGVSPFALSRAFPKITGFTLVEYINTTRIKEAQRLLAATELKIIQIAGLCGFESMAHFGRMFKKLTALSPAAYRKRSRLNSNPGITNSILLV